MPISKEVRLLGAKWQSGTGWAKRLDYVEIKGIRGWEGQRFEMRFPIMAVVGENGVGKSTVLQAAASVYTSAVKSRFRFASDFFPDTPWETIEDANVAAAIREGTNKFTTTVRKPGERWRGNPERRQRPVQYIDLSRIQPVSARVGYTRLANPLIKEVSAVLFEKNRLARLCEIMGRPYQAAKMALTEDKNRPVPVMAHQGASYSGFHQGAGETTVIELLKTDFHQNGLILIDEVETSLHPKVQRRLIRDLAEKCRELDLQIILTTHSPYILDELPLDARAYIMQGTDGQRKIIYGISPEFAMSKMDDVPQYECDLFVEDIRAAALLTEIIAAVKPELIQRCQIIPAGAASVVQALGQMVITHRFPRPARAFLDGDQGFAPGCVNLPGGDAPERVIFEGLRDRNWAKLADRTGRLHSVVADECSRAMLATNHHEWVDLTASKLVLGGDILWQAMCAEWVKECLLPEDAATVAKPVEDALTGIRWQAAHAPALVAVELPATSAPAKTASSAQQQLFELLPSSGAESKP